MVSVDVWSFSRVVRFLVQPFDPGHLFGLLADFDAVGGEHKAAIDSSERAVLKDDLPPSAHNHRQAPGLGPEMGNKGGIQLRPDAQSAHKRTYTTVVQPNDKAKDHHDKPVECSLARKTWPEIGQDATDMAYHVLSSFAKAKVLGAVRMNSWPELTFLSIAETMESRLSSMPWSCLTNRMISDTCTGRPADLSTY